MKTYHEDTFSALGVQLDIREEFYSVSRKNVIRGMHFQLPPHDHDKLVYCTQGAVRDVLLDLRKGSGYGGTASAEISAENAHMVFIPKGVAHGFVALTDQALMMYKTNTVYAAEYECGVLWDSFDHDWGCSNPILSDRDGKHLPFSKFVTPF